MFTISFALLYSNPMENQVKFVFDQAKTPSVEKLFLNTCEKQSSLRNNSQRFLGCRLDTVVQISSDSLILNEIEFGSSHHHISGNRILSYLFSDEFLKFAAFHNTADHRLTIYSLLGSIYLVRVPVLDAPSFPNHNSSSSYVFLAPARQSNEHLVSYFKRFNNCR